MECIFNSCHSHKKMENFNSCHSREGGNPWNYETVFRLHSGQQKKWDSLYRSYNDLKRRAYEHKNELVEGFTKKYSVHKLVHYERFDSIEYAVKREKHIKKWNRQWKINLIEKSNPQWMDLYK